jgi:hypothetical protein
MKRTKVKEQIVATLRKNLHFDPTNGVKGLNAAADDILVLCNDLWLQACLEQKQQDMNTISNAKTVPIKE